MQMTLLSDATTKEAVETVNRCLEAVLEWNKLKLNLDKVEMWMGEGRSDAENGVSPVLDSVVLLFLFHSAYSK